MSKNETVVLRILEEFRTGVLSRREAAELLSCSERAVTRRVKRLRESGIEGVKHGNYQRISEKKIEASKKEAMLAIAKKHYFDFNISHCLEMLAKNHDLQVSYATFHRWCREAGLGKRKRRRASKSRVHRERMAAEGFLLQMDGSHHKWNGKDEWCLIALIDDATSEIPAARFFEGETTLACMKVLRAVIEAKGVPQMIYTDGAGWAGGLKRSGFSQFVRACEELGIRVLTTNSPQAKGRIERAWCTTQDRLIPELRLAGITSMLDANRYLEQVYIAKYWHTTNTVAPKEAVSRYRELLPGENLDEIFCLKARRILRSDQTLSYEGEAYRIIDRNYGSLNGKEVVVHEQEDGSIKIFYGHIKLNHQHIPDSKRRWLRRRA